MTVETVFDLLAGLYTMIDPKEERECFFMVEKNFNKWMKNYPLPRTFCPGKPLYPIKEHL